MCECQVALTKQDEVAMRIEFKKPGTFQSLYAAEAWCLEKGISVGQSCATGPTGLLFGKYTWIAKWRNLTAKERAELHGTMSGDFREGPVIVALKDDAVMAHQPALLAKADSSEVQNQSAHLASAPKMAR